MEEYPPDRRILSLYRNLKIIERFFDMCVAIPGKVVELNGTKATVDFSGNKVNAEAGLVDVKVGDKVLVHAGCIIQTMDDKMADEMEELFREIEDLG